MGDIARKDGQQSLMMGQVISDILAMRAHPELLSEDEARIADNLAKALDQAHMRIKAADRAELSGKWQDWKELFLDSLKSGQTRRAYGKAIARLEAFCLEEGIEPTEMKHEGAVRFAQSSFCRGKESGEGERAAESVRLTLTAVSSLYSELSRLSEGAVYNPFLRLGAKPKAARAKEKAVPSSEELEAILAGTRGTVRAAIACMSYRGFRVGALPLLRLSTRDGQTSFETFTKGKAQRGVLPKAALDAIDAAGLSRKNPFEGIASNTLAMKVQRELDRLAQEGVIAGHAAGRKINGKEVKRIVSDYSCHSFRHFFAVTEYTKDRDVERVRRLLNHADLNTTQVYLQSLGLLQE